MRLPVPYLSPALATLLLPHALCGGMPDVLSLHVPSVYVFYPAEEPSEGAGAAVLGGACSLRGRRRRRYGGAGWARCLLPPRPEAAVRAGRCLLPPRAEACMQVPNTALAIPIQQRDGLHGGDAAGGGRGRRGHGMRS